MHKKIYPEKDSYIEKSTENFLKNFGRDELISISAPESDDSSFQTVVSEKWIDEVVSAFNTINFVGILSGSASGSASYINGKIDSCDGVVIPPPATPCG
jgi:hypothetical protein